MAFKGRTNWLTMGSITFFCQKGEAVSHFAGDEAKTFRGLVSMTKGIPKKTFSSKRTKGSSLFPELLFKKKRGNAPKKKKKKSEK